MVINRAASRWSFVETARGRSRHFCPREIDGIRLEFCRKPTAFTCTGSHRDWNLSPAPFHFHIFVSRSVDRSFVFCRSLRRIRADTRVLCRSRTLWFAGMPATRWDICLVELIRQDTKTVAKKIIKTTFKPM